MHVGYSPVFQNLTGELTDRQVYAQEVRLAELAEPLGFDSIWTTEHHFTEYEMIPSPTQFLTYMAGRTTHAKLGTMVIVLPWHDPMRVAEEVAMLDILSNGRMVLGIGRGLGAIEFDGFRLDMNQSRDRFVECAEAVLTGLEQGYVEYSGKHVQQPRRDIRPAPFRSFRGRTYGAGNSSDSMPIMARLGAGMLVVPQKRWDEVAEGIRMHREEWERVHAGTPRPKSVLVGFCIVDKDAGKAKDMAAKYIGRYYESVIKHYNIGGDHFSNTKGYEQYTAMSKAVKENAARVTEKFVNLMPWGTPDQVVEKLRNIDQYIDMGTFIAHFAFAGMPYDQAEASMRLFASDVLPALKEWKADATPDNAPMLQAAE